jgi:hypothetical protein
MLKRRLNSLESLKKKRKEKNQIETLGTKSSLIQIKMHLKATPDIK